MRSLNAITLALLLLQAVANGALAKAAAADTDTDTVEVVDYQNRSVILEKPALKIVALAPHIVENLFSLGLGDRIVAAVDYSDYPKKAAELPRVGSSSAINIEAILELRPDLVISWSSGNRSDILRRLIEFGVPVYFDEPRTLEDIARSLSDFATLTGTSDQADQLNSKFLRQINELRHQYLDRQPVSVFYQIWNDPLQTLNGEHLISAAISTCRGVNIFAQQAMIAPIVNMESLIKRDPQVILIGGDESSPPAWLDNWQRWQQISAVKEQHVYVVNADLLQRHSLRITQGIEQICAKIDRARDTKSD